MRRAWDRRSCRILQDGPTGMAHYRYATVPNESAHSFAGSHISRERKTSGRIENVRRRRQTCLGSAFEVGAKAVKSEMKKPGEALLSRIVASSSSRLTLCSPCAVCPYDFYDSYAAFISSRCISSRIHMRPLVPKERSNESAPGDDKRCRLNGEKVSFPWNTSMF
jgi:hypothetical protein